MSFAAVPGCSPTPLFIIASDTANGAACLSAEIAGAVFPVPEAFCVPMQ